MSEERNMLADSVAAFAGEGRGIARARQLSSEKSGLDRRVWSEMTDMGWLGMLVPESAGGLGLGAGDMAVVAEGLGTYCAPEPLIEVAFAQAVLTRCNESSLSRELLQESAQGDRLIAVAWQDHANNAVAEDLPDDLEQGSLNGVRYLVHPAEAEVFIVAIRDDDGLSLYSLPRGRAGMKIREQTRTDGSIVLTLEFENVVVEDSDRLASGRNGEEALRYGLSVAHVAASAELLGLASALFDMTTEFMATRKQFGQRLSAFQALRHRAVDLFIQRELMRNALRQAVRSFDNDSGLVELQLAASRAKARCADAALVIGRQAVQLHGAIGYTEEANVGVYLRRVLSLAAWLGNAASQRKQYTRLSREQKMQGERK